MEDHGIGEIRTRMFERAGRLLRGIDFRIAFVREDEETETPRQCNEPRQIGGVRDGALRVRGRGEIEHDRAREQIVRQRIEIGKKAVLRGRRQIDGFAVGGAGAGGVSGVKRIGNEDRRLAFASADIAARGDGAEEQAFARAVEHDDLVFGIERARQGVAARQPFPDGAAEILVALVGRVAAEFGEVLLQNRADKGRHRMLRLADREIDDRLAGRHVRDAGR